MNCYKVTLTYSGAHVAKGLTCTEHSHHPIIKVGEIEIPVLKSSALFSNVITNADLYTCYDDVGSAEDPLVILKPIHQADDTSDLVLVQLDVLGEPEDIKWKEFLDSVFEDFAHRVEGKLYGVGKGQHAFFVAEGSHDNRLEVWFEAGSKSYLFNVDDNSNLIVKVE